MPAASWDSEGIKRTLSRSQSCFQLSCHVGCQSCGCTQADEALGALGEGGGAVDQSALAAANVRRRYAEVRGAAAAVLARACLPVLIISLCWGGCSGALPFGDCSPHH